MLAAPPDGSLDLARLHLAPIETDRHRAAGYRFPHARGLRIVAFRWAARHARTYAKAQVLTGVKAALRPRIVTDHGCSTIPCVNRCKIGNNSNDWK